MRNIKEGDKVWVCFSSHELDILGGIVEHTPDTTGDMWYIKDAENRSVAVNPQSSELIFIKKIS